MIPRLLLKTLRDRWKSSLSWVAALLALCSVQLYIYPSIKDSADAMNEFLKAFPKELIDMFRIEDYTSGAGFLGTELFSMMIPIIFISLGSSWGASAIAEEEKSGTAETLFTLPVSRTRILLTKLIAAWLVMITVSVVVLVVITVGAGIVGLDLTNVNLLSATAGCLALGIFFHGLSLGLGTVTGKRGLAMGASIAVGLISFLIFALAPTVDSFDSILWAIPFEWALGNKPLVNGFDWQGLVTLLGLSVVGYLSALISINRRDIQG